MSLLTPTCIDFESDQWWIKQIELHAGTTGAFLVQIPEPILSKLQTHLHRAASGFNARSGRINVRKIDAGLYTVERTDCDLKTSCSTQTVVN